MLDILVIDDEPDVRASIAQVLRGSGHTVAEAADGVDALAQLGDRVFDIVVSDVRLPKLDGFSVLRKVRSDLPWTDVLLMTAFGSVPDAVLAMKEKAIDYLLKPFDADQLLAAVDRIAQRRGVDDELRHAAADLESAAVDDVLVGRAPALLRMREELVTMAGTDASVLISGETGTGKELVAQAIHRLGKRGNGPFVVVNCAAFPLTLFEAELFGHERGAFTGAVQRREGRFKAAHGGTLFLDEVGETPLEAQAKLLRVLQEGTFEPIGSNETHRSDVRIIAATNRDLKIAIAEGRFRDDLFYRLKVLELHMPPLRERRDDLALLARHFLMRYCAEGEVPTLSPSAWAALRGYSFPGNVRELEHAIRHALVMSHGKEIDLQHLPADIRGGALSAGASQAGLRPLVEAMEDFEKEYLGRALTLTGGRRTKAADLLGISRKSLWQRMRRHGL